jgi:hypothetical protein
MGLLSSRCLQRLSNTLCKLLQRIINTLPADKESEGLDNPDERVLFTKVGNVPDKKSPEYSRGRLSKALGQLGLWEFGRGGMGEGWERGGSRRVSLQAT